MYTDASSRNDLSEALRLALEIVPDAAVAVDGEGRIVGANQAVHDLFGHPLESLVGQRIETLVPERFRHAHRHHRGAFAQAPRSRAMGAGLQLSGRRHDASEFPVDISLAPVPGADPPLVVAAIRDITERGAVAAAVAQLAAIVSSSRDAILTVTTSGVVSTWNPGAEQLLGTPTEEAVGSHLGRWVPEDTSADLEELMGIIVSGGSPAPRDTTWQTADAKRVEVAISLSPLEDAHANLRGFSILARDITERKAIEAAHLRQERWQAATAEIRLDSLSDGPLVDTLELVCRRAFALVEGEGAAMVRQGPQGPQVMVSAGRPRHEVIQDLAEALLSSGEAAPSMLDLAVTTSGRPFHAVGALVPSQSAPSRVLVVTLPPGREGNGDVQRIVEGLAGQAALAIELAEARETRDRLLLAEDRERIARDLHDLVIQRLFATGMSLQMLQQVVGNEAASQRLAEAADELDTTIREIRTTIFDLEARSETTDGVRGELLRLVSAATKSLGFHPSLQFDGPVDLVDPELHRHAVAVTREALSNVARHAQASSASVVVVAREGFEITVEDDGVGVPESHRESGLSNLRGRAEALGGQLVLENRSGGGARMVWRVPGA